MYIPYHKYTNIYIYIYIYWILYGYRGRDVHLGLIPEVGWIQQNGDLSNKLDRFILDYIGCINNKHDLGMLKKNKRTHIYTVYIYIFNITYIYIYT